LKAAISRFIARGVEKSKRPPKASSTGSIPPSRSSLARAGLARMITF